MLDPEPHPFQSRYVKEALKKREYDVDFSELLEWDARRRALRVENESLKAERNRMSKEIPALKKQGKDASELLAKLKEMADQVKAMDEEQSALEDKIYRFVVALAQSAGRGRGGRRQGEQPGGQGLRRKARLRLGAEEPRGPVHGPGPDRLRARREAGPATASGSTPAMGARLEWALLNYFISEPPQGRLHLHAAAAHPFDLCLRPHGRAVPQVREDDVYRVDAGDDGFRFLLPTAGDGADQPLPRRDPRGGGPAQDACLPTRPATAARPAPTAPASAA